MKVAFLNLCHCDPEIVEKSAKQLTQNKNFYMYIHVDKKKDDIEFKKRLKNVENVFFVENRKEVYWGGFNAIMATIELLKEALNSKEKYDRFMLLQNLDYPIKSNSYIEKFFEENKDVEFIRACKISNSKDWHFKEKYKLKHNFDDEFYLKNNGKIAKLLHDIKKVIISIPNLSFNGVIKDDKNYYLYYGSAQWAITRECAEYIVNFYNTHKKFNEKMKNIKFPDEEYFQTIVHNSNFKCSKANEPEKRWLVNWRNLHYYEYPREITVFNEHDYEKLINKEELFIRKVKSGVSDKLIDMINKKIN